MKLEDQVVSLDLAKKLKELGVKQESAFYWAKDHVSFKLCVPRGNMFVPVNFFAVAFYPEWEHFAAFTVAELLNMLQSIRNCEIIIPVVSNVADYLAQELIDEKCKEKD